MFSKRSIERDDECNKRKEKFDKDTYRRRKMYYDLKGQRYGRL
jgi:hypothetical protein